ncbi:hypothetical protein JOF41_007305 [Saccharothrix coeruleofusca]|uniref:hypothetical protein n=1 Tax=Saccharothrix coeruleofusca TaxID=33919 RepID=UPI001AE3B276|nr:hypothetical protein [Saccharothrix coeruleofusca]MBP2341051.1 hypothetical protein [Saccharothrix coeruleofusca]
MSGVVAVPVGGRVVVVCCGQHCPAPGEASVCRCCAECPTTAIYAGVKPHVRARVARAERDDRALLRAALRRVEHALAVAALWDAVRRFGSAWAHAVELPPEDYPPQQGVLA